MKKLLIIFVLLLGARSLNAQITLPLTGVGYSNAVNNSVTFFHGKSNYGGSNNGTAAPLGTTSLTGCASFTWCGTFSQTAASLTGNTASIRVLYTHATSVSLTVKVGSTTLTAGPVTTAENGQILAEFYGSNLTTVAAQPYTIFDSGSVGITIDWVGSELWAGIATSGTLRTSCSTQAAASNTIVGCAVTPTIGDLILMTACTPGTPIRTSFTPGTSYAKVVSDIRNGCVSQWRTAATGTSQTPQLTTAGTASVYVVTVSVYAADSTKGTIPTQPYVSYAPEISTPSGSASGASFAYELPSVGKAEVITMGCGQYSISSITDATNTWKVLTPSTLTVSGSTTTIAVAQNASANPSGAVSITFVSIPGTGDCDGYAYDVVGDATTSIGNRMQASASQGSAGNLTMLTNFMGATSKGLHFAIDSHASNTSTGQTVPSGASFQGTRFAGQSSNGPSEPMQNNYAGINPVSSNAQETWTETFWDGTTAAGAWTAEGVAVLGSGGAFGVYSPAQVSGNSVSGSGASTTMTPGSAITVSSGQALAMVVTWDGATTTISSCTDNLNAGNWSVAHGPTTGTTGFTTQRMETLYRLNTAAGSLTVTCHFSATITASNDWMSVHAISGLASGGTYDSTASPAIKTAASAGNPHNCNISGTTSATNEYGFSAFVITTAVQTVAPNITIQQEQSANSFGDASGDVVFGATGTYTPSWNGSSSGATFCAFELFF